MAKRREGSSSFMEPDTTSAKFVTASSRTKERTGIQTHVQPGLLEVGLPMMKPLSEETEHCNGTHRHPEVIHPSVEDSGDRGEKRESTKQENQKTRETAHRRAETDLH